MINIDDVVAWVDNEHVYCTDCIDARESGNLEPRTVDNYDEGDMLQCDKCGGWIKIIDFVK